MIAMKKILSSLFLAGSVIALSGCATSPEKQAKQAELNKTVPVCSSKADCDATWEAAQLWVIHHANYKIQIANNVIIETYHPVGGTPSIGARVTKEPIGGGKYALFVSVYCDNMFGCVPDSLDAALDFNRTVSAATP